MGGNEDTLDRPALMEAILHGMQDGVVAADETGLIVMANPAADRLLGVRVQGLTAEAWAKEQTFWLPDGTGWYPDNELPLARALRGNASEADVFFRPPYQEEGIWLSMSARPVPGGGAVAVLRNVTSRQQLRDIQAMYRSLVEGLPLCLYRKDLEGRYLFVNWAFCRTMALTEDEVLMRTDADFQLATMAEGYRLQEVQVADAQAVLERLEEHRPADCGAHCRCGPRDELGPGLEPRYVQSVLTPVRNGEGKVVGVQGAFWDATPWRRAVRDLERSLADQERLSSELRRSNSDLERFAYIASHDLQEPARMVLNFTQLLERRAGDKLDENARQYLHFACDGARRMQGLIRDLLSYSRVATEGRPMLEADSAAALQRALDDLRQRVEETRAEVTWRGLPKLRADPAQLTQLFQNLVGNALKFSRHGTVPRVDVSAELQAGQWVFRVQDNGIGIEERFRERIFDIFQRLHGREEYDGNGIGLSICKRIVERHGGRIWVESEVGVGSTFWFSIPARWLEAD